MLFDRTFHPDEANQAFTVGRLLETGAYTYKPTDHHGPTLYYAAAPLQRAFGHTTTATLDGTLLRCTPLIFGVLTLVFLAEAVYGLVRYFGGTPENRATRRLLPALAAGAATLLLGTSPLFVFYATDFIQETLLACFTAMALKCAIGYAVARQPPEDPLHPRRLKPGTWAIFFGFSIGLCFATKETCSLSFAAAILAAAPFLAIHLKRNGICALADIIRPNDVVLGLLAFVLTSAVLFSSFCQDWMGVYNAFIAAPLSYVHRAAGEASAGGADWHIHPWWQYIHWFFLGQPSALPANAPADHVFAHLHPLLHWAVLLLMLGGRALWNLRSKGRVHPLILAFFGFSLYFATLLGFYSAIPYKTPWCAVQLLLGFVPAIVLGYTAAARELLVALTPTLLHASRQLRLFVTGLVYVGCLCLTTLIGVAEHLPGLQLMARDPDSRAIPYNYAHSSPEVKDLAVCVDAAIKSAPDPKKAFIAVSLPPEDTWPFPWYNRTWEPLTGYWTKFDDLVELEKTGARPTVVIVPMREGHLVQPLFPHLKHTKRFFIRPGVRARVFW